MPAMECNLCCLPWPWGVICCSGGVSWTCGLQNASWGRLRLPSGGLFNQGVELALRPRVQCAVLVPEKAVLGPASATANLGVNVERVVGDPAHGTRELQPRRHAGFAGAHGFDVSSHIPHHLSYGQGQE
jgi:hypothetical protein